MKSRKEIMLILLELNKFFTDQMNESGLFGTSNRSILPVFTPSWLDEKYDRFYMVESTTNREEEFTVNIELRYSLRSAERKAMTNGHKAYYDGYHCTTAVPLSAIEDPESYKAEVRAEFAQSKLERESKV